MAEQTEDKRKTARNKSRILAVRIVKLYQYLCKEKQEYILSKQVLRSGTSIGANLAEAEYAISEKEFLAKVYIALKESSETLFWLDVLFQSEYIIDKEYNSIYTETLEILKMLQATTKTISKRLNSTL